MKKLNFRVRLKNLLGIKPSERPDKSHPSLPNTKQENTDITVPEPTPSHANIIQNMTTARDETMSTHSSLGVVRQPEGPISPGTSNATAPTSNGETDSKPCESLQTAKSAEIQDLPNSYHSDNPMASQNLPTKIRASVDARPRQIAAGGHDDTQLPRATEDRAILDRPTNRLSQVTFPSDMKAPVSTRAVTQSNTTGSQTHVTQGDRYDHPCKRPVRVWTETSQESEPDHSIAHGREVSVSGVIDCDIRVYTPMDESPLVKSTRIPWTTPGQYEEVKLIAERLCEERLQRKFGPDYHHHLIYPVESRVYIFRDDNRQELGSEEVQTLFHWNQRVPCLIAHHSSTLPWKRLRLIAEWRVEFVSIHRRKGKNLSEKVFSVLQERLKLYQNILNEVFLPQKELDVIFDRDVVEGLISEADLSGTEIEAWKLPPDQPLPPGKSKHEHLADIVYLNAPRILATLIFTDKLHSCLLKLIEGGKTDDDLPMDESELPSGATPFDFRNFWGNQKQFSVHKFDKLKPLGKDTTIKKDVTVPVMFKKKEAIGHGGFGEVFEVTIHRQHHNFDIKRFALKRLYETAKAAENFKHETEVLATLGGLKHDSITIPLTAWQQSGKFYMLFPLADSNLKTFLRSQPAPRRDKAFVNTLLKNLVGLGDALEAIHTMKDSGLPGANLLSPDAGRTRQRTGYHHDLKPENILIFEGQHWKIHDFGTARISEAISGGFSDRRRNLDAGDPIYSAPDWDIQEYTSRPYDIWSFGCIILEVLLWVFDYGQSVVAEFELQRLNDTTGGFGRPAFWMSDNGVIKRRPAVDRKLRDLSEWTKDYPQFNQLLELVKRMLRVKVEDRPVAEKVLSDLKAVKRAAEHELSRNPEFYMGPRLTQHPFTAPVTDLGDTQSDAASFGDQVEHGAGNASPDRLDKPSPARPRRRSTSSTAQRQPERLPKIQNGDFGYIGVGSHSAFDDESSTPLIKISTPPEPLSPDNQQTPRRPNADDRPPYQNEMRPMDYKQ